MPQLEFLGLSFSLNASVRGRVSWLRNQTFCDTQGSIR